MIDKNSDASRFGIIHLSDIHFSMDNDNLSSKFDALFSALKDNFLNCAKIFIVISGDIANTGSPKEYEKALNFLKRLSNGLTKRYSNVGLRFIIVPGNHDCNFTLDSQLRQNTVQNINYESIGDDNSVIDICTGVQSEFWGFYSSFNEPPQNKLFFDIIENINESKICFHCINTAWMSEKKEKPGTLFFPVKLFSKQNHANGFSLEIAVYHHPVYWFNPNAAENNRKEVQELFDSISSIQIIGHEHENELRQTANLNCINSHALCTSGEILQSLSNPGVSGFQTFIMDLENRIVSLRRYSWKNDFYQKYSEKEIPIENKDWRIAEFQEEFLKNLNMCNLPLAFEEKSVTLSDLFIFPDLEDINPNNARKIIDYIDSMTLLKEDKEGIFVLEGDSQVGKTSLLKMFALKLYKLGHYPIILSGNKITNDNVEKLAKIAFKQQYVDNEDNYERFRQLPKELKTLLIDDFHECKLSKSNRHKIVESFGDLFRLVLLTVDTTFSMLPQSQSSFNSWNCYSIKPLGYLKRNRMIEKYVKYKYSYSADSETLFDKVNETFNKLAHVLRNNLIPPNPIFVLTIIQSLDFTPVNINQTSYGYCYQSLIHLALRSSGVPNDHIDAYFNFLTELAFGIFDRQACSISENDLLSFYSNYRQRFWTPDFEIVKSKLLNSKIIKTEFGEYQFCYIYILYFLAAKKIAEMIDKNEGREVVNKLFDELHKEKNANVLVFITHHTKNDSFIEESILSAMMPFDRIAPITLEKNCKYFQLLQEVVKVIKNDFIEMKDPNREREKHLSAQDSIERSMQNTRSDHETLETEEYLRPFLQAFRAIEIVGQILRNRKGSLEKATIKEMITELYYAGFRMIGFLGELIEKSKDELSVRMKEKVKENDTNYDIENKIYRFLQIISLQCCLGVFTKLIRHIGVKELREIFNDVAIDINTPAAHLVTFSINTFYGKVNIKELESLSKQFKDNYVAFQILRSRIKAYVYNNHVDYKLKQKIGAFLNMNVSGMIALNQSKH